MQENFHHSEAVNPAKYRYADVNIILGQDFNVYVRPLEYCQDKSQKAPFAVRLPIGWVLIGPHLSSSDLIST